MTKTKKTRNYNLEEQTYQFIKVFFYNCFGYSIIACLFGRQEVCSLFDIWSLGFVILNGGETNPEYPGENPCQYWIFKVKNTRNMEEGND